MLKVTVTVLALFLAPIAAKPFQGGFLSLLTGLPKYDGRIVGGVPTTIEKHPWQLSFLFRGSHNCGASIISSNWVLTAAHCVDPNDFPQHQLSFRSGSSLHASGGALHEIDKIIIHPNYKPSTYDYDVALVKVRNPFDLKKVSAVKLVSEGTLPATGTIAQVTGWGRLRENGPIPDQLQLVEVPTLSTDVCKKSYGSARITDRMFCAGYEEGVKDACGGDSGGPLVINNVLHGIVSWGSGCARPNKPGVYTSVQNLRSWIAKKSGV